jgi:hypothetical protein
MKKILFFLVLVFVSGVSQGQIGFGAKGAVTMSKLTTDISDIQDAARAGWQAGIFMRIGDRWHLQPEAYLTAKTGKLEYTGLDVNDPAKTGKVRQDITFTSVDVPLLIGFKVIDPPAFNIRLQAGPVMSFMVNKKFEVSSEGITPPDLSGYYEDAFKNTNWGLQFGAGVDFLFLTADLRYEMGLNDMFDDDGTATGNQDPTVGTFKNNVFILSVGFKLL